MRLEQTRNPYSSKNCHKIFFFADKVLNTAAECSWIVVAIADDLLAGQNSQKFPSPPILPFFFWQQAECRDKNVELQEIESKS